MDKSTSIFVFTSREEHVLFGAALLTWTINGTLNSEQQLCSDLMIT